MMSVRLNFIVEGQTEETFVNLVLTPHLAINSVWCSARCVTTGRKRGVAYRGGLGDYRKVKNDIVLWMKEERGPEAFFTTMFDLYALPVDFPGYQESRRFAAPSERVKVLEDAMIADMRDPRFIPYIQMHEFEALLLTDSRKFDCTFLNHDKAIDDLARMAGDFSSPELIDDGKETAPSKRIIKEIPEYEARKASAGPLIAEKIGLSALRGKCKHFGAWVDRLESLSKAGDS